MQISPNKLNKSQRDDAACLSVVITYPFPIGQASGGSRMTREIARNLGRLGVKVVIMPVSSNARKPIFPRAEVERESLGFQFDSELAEDGVEVLRVAQHQFHLQLDGLAVRRALNELLKTRHIDCVLSYYNEGAFLHSFLRARNIKFGYIATWQSYAWGKVAADSQRRLSGLVAKKTYDRIISKPHKQADILFATSRFTREELIDVIGVAPERIVVNYLGVESHFARIPRKRPDKITQLVYFGRIVFTKGIIDAIKALGKLAARGITDWNFRVIGESGKPALAETKRLADELGISDKISYCDALDDQGLCRELEQADLAIMPSYSESFGLAFAEAQAAAVPVVAYKVGSLSEVIEDGVTGWLAPVHDIEHLAGLIEKALADPDGTWQAGLAGRERVIRKFNWKNTSATIMNSLEQLLQREAAATGQHSQSDKFLISA